MFFLQLDGYIARNWPSQASKFGSFLDPLADKLLVGTLYVSLTYTGLLPIWLTCMVLFRDVFLIAAAFVIRYISLPPPVNIFLFFRELLSKFLTIFVFLLENIQSIF